MNYISFMQVLNSLHKLVHNISIVQIFEDFLSNGIMQICLHKLENQVQIFIVLCLYHSVKLHDVLVLNLMQKNYFAVCALCVCGVLEGVKYLF